jgi:carbamoyl-phosphate synthase large subunit
MDLVESGVLDYIVYTGKSDKKSIEDYIRLFNRANQLGIATITSLDTANALADIIASRYKQSNTELVDINNMRSEKGILKFSKMHGTGDDYIFFNNECGIITCPESFAIEFTDRHRGIGGDGIVLIEGSDVADAKMRIFNLDGSEGKMAGNSIRCVGKYLYDNGWVDKENITVETASGIRELQLFTRNGKVSSVTVNMGKAELKPKQIPVCLRVTKSSAGRRKLRAINTTSPAFPSAIRTALFSLTTLIRCRLRKSARSLKMRRFSPRGLTPNLCA